MNFAILKNLFVGLYTCIYWLANDEEDFVEFMEGAVVFGENDIDGSISSGIEDDKTLMLICQGNIIFMEAILLP